jgi:hypothetical protein
VMGHSGLFFGFSFFTGNSGGGCLLLSWVGTDDISCLDLYNNTCLSDSTWPGFVSLGGTMTFRNCVFQSNSFDCFLGGPADDSASATFYACVFDFSWFSTSRSLSFAIQNCHYDNKRTVLSEYRVVLRPFTVSFMKWLGMISGIGIAVLLGFLGFCSLCRKCYRHGNSPALHPPDPPPRYANGPVLPPPLGWRGETINLGTMTLYHETDEIGWRGINAEQQMRVGTREDLMFGKGIYFVEYPSQTQPKACHRGVMLSARVKIDRAMILESPCHDFDPRILYQEGCGGVKGHRAPGTVWEYVVYESQRVTQIQHLNRFSEPL